jgi:predicted ATPase with chaperone activity
VVINLAPAELPKSAGSFDLPIAVGILAGSGQFKSDCSTNTQSSASWRSTAARGQ